MVSDRSAVSCGAYRTASRYRNASRAYNRETGRAMKYVSTIVGVLIASTIFVAGAQGGTYQVSACMGLAPVTNESWVKFNSSLTYLETPSECGGGEVTG